MKKRYILLIVAISVGGYLYSGFPLPSSHTSDPRMAYIFAREGLGFAGCVNYYQPDRDMLTIPIREDPGGAPGTLTVGRFKSEKVRKFANQLSQGRFEIVTPQIAGIRLVGDTSEEYCGSWVSQIVVVEDLAIARFSSPGGDFGAYAFERGILGWRAVERVHLGWW